jgi:hypothetical protein
MTQSTLRLELFGSATAAALLGATICYDANPGLNWALWTLLVSTELAIFARPRLGANRGAFDITVGFAVLLGIGATVTANPASIALIFVSVATLLGVAARLAAGLPAPLLGVRQVVLMPFVATFDAIRECLARVESAVRAVWSDTGARVLRGLVIAVPTISIFSLLLAGADPTLASWLHGLSSLLSDWSWFPRFAFFGLLAALSLGTFGLASGALSKPTLPGHAADARFVLSDTERRIVVGAVVTLFALFLALESFSHQVRGQSYTAYVHNGFAQLTIVATLSVLLVAVLHDGRPRIGVPWGTLALLTECELLVASALYRIAIYQRDYGYTALRMWVTAYMLLVAALLALLAYEVARPLLIDARRFVRRGAILNAAALTVMVYGNPDAWVATLELHRYLTTGKLNVLALADLSADAVPTVITIAKSLPPGCTDRLGLELGPRREWYEWNARGARARRALDELSPTHALETCRIEPW